MLNIIIFSKDRASQLDLLIRSIKKFFVDWDKYKFSVLYTYSNDEYKKGYDLTIQRHPEFSFVLEDNFKVQLCGLIKDENPYTLFFVDDNVFKEPFNLSCPEFEYFTKHGDNMLSLTLRLGKNTRWCYTRREESIHPRFLSGMMCIWLWKDAKGAEWNYPMSVDGGIFRTSDIKPLAEKLGYENPNTFEGSLANHPIDKPGMICMEQSVIFNIPVNKVQTANGNKCGNIPAKVINDSYLNGKQLSINNLIGYNNKAPHEEIKFEYEDM